ncbi:uncharacterized protein AB675_5265 [Cyphellophora attinorum]|uniref:Uncharacterized protein n=1 Tax=Cyphellophora attinorum TaxID=1664694 RepID=A0A0N1P0Q6_9EURO|nr:uncharacterized protein AB675_5265 [Phialophora attinorum]KPI39407.1 hypothetical protein AB675_5265 [Phialophora attinorum]
MIAVSLFLGAVVVLLYLRSDGDNGFSLIINSHFVWTYAPTAVLVFMVAVWRQVDFHTKVVASWVQLSYSGQQPASKTVLLDYLSPIQISSFKNAIRNQHVAVVLGIIGSILSKLTVLVSTALFVALPIFQDAPATGLMRTTAFDGRLANVDDIPTLNDSSLVYTAYARFISAQPEAAAAATESCTYEASGLQASDQAGVRTSLQAVFPEYRCGGIATSTILDQNSTEQNPNHVLRIEDPTCQFPNGRKTIQLQALNPRTFRCPPEQITPIFERLTCNGNGTNWHLLGLIDFRYEQSLTDIDQDANLGAPVEAINSSTSANRGATIACEVTYSMVNATQTCKPAGTSPPSTLFANSTLLSESVIQKLDGLSDADLARLFLGSLFAASDMFGNVLDEGYALEYPNTMLKFMAKTVSGGRYDGLFDEDKMARAAQSVFPRIAVPLLQKNFIANASVPLTANGRFLEERLFLNPVAVWLMLAGFTLMSMVAALLACRRPIFTIWQNPESTVTAGLILAQDPEVETCFRNDGDPNLFQTITQHKFELDTSAARPWKREQYLLLSSGPDRLDRSAPTDTPHWWRSLFLRPWIYTSCLLLPFFSIGALEILQHFSDRSQGFGTSSLSAGNVLKFDLRNVFPLVALLIASLVNSIDFNIAALAPFQAARRGWADARTLAPVLGRVPLTAIHHLIITQNWGPFLSAVASFTAAFLTIVASGLYNGVLQEIQSNSTITLSYLDQFEPIWNNSVLDDGSAVVLASIYETSNFSYTALAYDELALRALSLSDSDLRDVNNAANSSWVVETPALRASLVCEAALATQFNTTTTTIQQSGASVLIQASLPLPSNCLFGGPNGTDSNIDFTTSFKLPTGANTGTIGKLIDLHVGPFDPALASSTDEINPSIQRDNPPGCPSLAFVYGHMDVFSEARSLVNVLMCYQHLDEIPTLASYSLSRLNDGTIIPAESISPPGPIPNGPTTPIPVPNSLPKQYAFPFRPQLHLDRRLAIFNQTRFPSSNSGAGDGNSPVDPFFQAVLFGRRSVSEDHLRSTDPATMLAVQDAIQGVYRRYMALVISAKMRVPLLSNNSADGTGTDTAATVQATLTHRTLQVRLTQSSTSKLILQILLGIITITMSLALYLTETREVLMYNPCCFAGLASLWAGSAFVKRVGKDALFLTGERELRERLGEWEFRLGWCEGDLVVHGRRGRRWGLEGRRKAKQGEGTVLRKERLEESSGWI